MTVNRRAALMLAGLAGFLGIALGAFGAHALKGILALNNSREVWNTAVLYHLVHSPALLWAATSETFLPEVVLFWGFGLLIFSGSLYLLALTGTGWLGAVTPIGGFLLMAGWARVFGKALRYRP